MYYNYGNQLFELLQTSKNKSIHLLHGFYILVTGTTFPTVNLRTVYLKYGTTLLEYLFTWNSVAIKNMKSNMDLNI